MCVFVCSCAVTGCTWFWTVRISYPRRVIAESFWQWTDLEYNHIKWSYVNFTGCNAATTRYQLNLEHTTHIQAFLIQWLWNGTSTFQAISFNSCEISLFYGHALTAFANGNISTQPNDFARERWNCHVLCPNIFLLLTILFFVPSYDRLHHKWWYLTKKKNCFFIFNSDLFWSLITVFLLNSYQNIFSAFLRKWAEHRLF